MSTTSDAVSEVGSIHIVPLVESWAPYLPCHVSILILCKRDVCLRSNLGPVHANIEPLLKCS